MSVQKTVKIRGGFASIKLEDYFRPSLKEKGAHLLQHIFNVEEEHSDSGCLIHGSCIPQTSLNKEPYRVELQISLDRTILSGHCNCVSGVTGICKHASALAHFINSERTESSTDVVQVWQKPSQVRQALYPKGDTIESLFQLEATSPPSYKPNESKLSQFRALLESENATTGMFYKCLTVERCEPVPFKVVPSPKYPDNFLDKIFFSPDHPKHCKVAIGSGTKKIFRNISSTLSMEHQKFYLENVALSNDQCQTVFLNTIGQNKNSNWFRQRKFRISASKAHKILHSRKRETRLKYFFDSSFVNQDMIYGQETESKAKVTFESSSQLEVLSSGLIVQPAQSWLCASPDGLIAQNNSCLEIKCPSSCKNDQINVDYIQNNALVKTHPYYTQVQIQMYCMNADFCHFFVYSDIDQKSLLIEKDDEFL